jgi:hypothetical protein
VKLAREELKRIQREVVGQEQRAKILQAKFSTICLKHSAGDQQEGSSLVHLFPL